MASHIYLYFLSIIIVTTLGFPLNLTLTDYHNPQAQCLSTHGGHCAPTNCPSFKNLLPNSL